jgi:hypothetical protein
MNIKSYYYFLEKGGNYLYDYFDKNNLIYNNNLIEYDEEGFIFNNQEKSYFNKLLDVSYIGSFSLLIKLKLESNENYEINKKYLIFDSNENNNYSFGIYLTKNNSDNYTYFIKLNNFNYSFNFYEIFTFSYNNNLHNLIIKWNEDTMNLDTYFIENINDISNIEENKKNYSYDPYNNFYNGNLPSNEGLDLYSISINNIMLGGRESNNIFSNFLGRILFLCIDSELFTDLEIFNLIKLSKTIDNDYFLNGSNYFENTNGYFLKDNTTINNIFFEYMNENKPTFISDNTNKIINQSNNNLNGWLKYDYTDTNQFNSYLFSNNLDDYFLYTLDKSNYYSYSITLWVRGKNIVNESSIFSIKIPTSNIEFKWATIDFIIKKNTNNYQYYIEVNGRDTNYNKIDKYKIRELIVTIEKDFQWDHICFCYDNLISYNNNCGNIKIYINKDSTISLNSKLKLDLLKDSKINLGLNSNSNKKFTGFISGLQIFNEYIDQVTVDRTFDDLENCYHPDTNILTNKGYVKIKNLKRGDRIKTLNNGYQKLARLIITPAKKISEDYILFKKGCFGPNKPNEDLIITKGHPVYYKNDFYNPEDFVNSLIFNVEIINLNIQKVYHLQFEEHYLINSNNIYTTSLPSNTNYLNLYLPKEFYFNKKKFNIDNIGKHYPPYFLHNEPIPIGKIE